MKEWYMICNIGLWGFNGYNPLNYRWSGKIFCEIKIIAQTHIYGPAFINANFVCNWTFNQLGVIRKFKSTDCDINFEQLFFKQSESQRNFYIFENFPSIFFSVTKRFSVFQFLAEHQKLDLEHPDGKWTLINKRLFFEVQSFTYYGGFGNLQAN